MAKSVRKESSRLLALLPSADRALLEEHLTDFSSASGKVLHEPGQTIDHIYFPHSGMISLLTVMNDGRGIEIATVGSEGAVGVITALGSKSAMARAVVQIEMVASRISRERFLQCVEQSPAILNLVQRANDAFLGQVQQTAACNALHQIEARLARWLLQSHDRTTGDHVPLTQEFLSEMLAVRRTSVTEVAQALQNEGFIKYRRGNIEIIDRDGLERKACECYGVVAGQTKKLLSKSFG